MLNKTCVFSALLAVVAAGLLWSQESAAQKKTNSKQKAAAREAAPATPLDLEKELILQLAGKHAEAVRKMSEEELKAFIALTQKWRVPQYRTTSPAEERIEQKLTEQTAIEFVDTPLIDGLAFLEDMHECPITWDEAAINEAGIRVDPPITIRLKGVTLRNALELMLGGHQLDFLVANESLRITTKTAAAKHFETRVYETRHLPNLDDATLSKVIQTTVSPTTWRIENDPRERHAAIAVIPGGLVINQTQRAHQRIVDLLQQLDAQQGNPLYGVKQ